jgi:hypothetical protein
VETAAPPAQTLPSVIEQPANSGLVARTDQKNSEVLGKSPASAQKSQSVRTEKNRMPDGDSKVLGLRKPRVIGIQRSLDFQDPSGISVKDTLETLGVDAAYSNLSWEVRGVKQNSTAERSGLKTGDVIEAIDNQNLTENTTFRDKFGGKTVRVRRDGKSVQVDLRR